MHEAQFYDETSFLTLTYNPESLPPDGSLQVRDLQLFLKRYRQYCVRDLATPRRVRFFGCGEYGERLERPHYHAIIFGHAFLEDRKPWSKGNAGDQVYISPTLHKLWGHGDCYIGSVSLQSAGYVARYTVKKVKGDRAAEHYQGKKPEFMVCSKGIGLRFFEAYQEETFRDDFVVFKGKRMAVPDYYNRKFVQAHGDDRMAPIKAARLARALAHEADLTPRRLADREEVTKARITSLKRT